jgi:hypothetical protein
MVKAGKPLGRHRGDRKLLILAPTPSSVISEKETLTLDEPGHWGTVADLVVSPRNGRM